MYYNQKIGKFGETLAKNYLLKKGYKIIDTNVKTSYKEIDIVAKRQSDLVFVEVKTRTSTTLGRADQAVSRRKLSNLRKAVGMYIYRKNYNPLNIRVDLIAIDVSRSKKTAKIKHYKSII